MEEARKDLIKYKSGQKAVFFLVNDKRHLLAMSPSKSIKRSIMSLTLYVYPEQYQLFVFTRIMSAMS